MVTDTGDAADPLVVSRASMRSKNTSPRTGCPLLWPANLGEERAVVGDALATGVVAADMGELAELPPPGTTTSRPTRCGSSTNRTAVARWCRQRACSLSDDSLSTAFGVENRLERAAPRVRPRTTTWAGLRALTRCPRCRVYLRATSARLAASACRADRAATAGPAAGPAIGPAASLACGTGTATAMEMANVTVRRKPSGTADCWKKMRSSSWPSTAPRPAACGDMRVARGELATLLDSCTTRALARRRTVATRASASTTASACCNAPPASSMV